MKYDAAWMAGAECAKWSEAQFFPEEGSREEPWRWKRAIAKCDRCPVKRECLTYALEMELADAIPLGDATVLESDWERACKPSCPTNCKDQQHWRKASDKVTFATRKFSASFTPPVGVWGGTTPGQRHALRMKHLIVVDGQCVLPHCKGCRPLDEWVNLLMGEEAA